MILELDKLINSEKSFVNMFPEFTSFLNTISLSNVTISSNPSIYSGNSFSLINKDSKGGVNPISNMENINMTQNDWYYYSIKNMVDMYNAEGIRNINLNNLPYYNDSNQSWWYGNMYKLRRDLAKDNINVNTVTNEHIAKYKLGMSEGQDPGNLYDGCVWEHMSELIKFENKSSTFFSNFSQQIHGPSIIKSGNKITSSQDNDKYLDSMYLMLQQLKNFLLRLKSEPFIDKNTGKPVLDKSGNKISVYDKSLIFILSDHGTPLSIIPSWSKMLHYMNEKSIISNKDLNLILQYKYERYNPLMTFKDYKYDINNVILSNKEKFTFDTDKILALSDVQQIIQNSLNKYNNIEVKSFFVGPEFYNYISNPNIRSKIKEGMLINPLDDRENSIALNNMNNRIFYLAEMLDWRFNAKKKRFDIKSILKFEKVKTNKSIFYNDNYKSI